MQRQLRRDGGAHHEELQLLDGRRIHTSRGVAFTIPDDVKDDELVNLVLDGSNRFVAEDGPTKGHVEREAHRRQVAADAEEAARQDAIELKREERHAEEKAASDLRVKELAAFKATANLEPAPAPEEPVTIRSTTDVPGIGPVAAEKLSEAGIATVQDLAKSDAATVSDALGVSEAKAKTFIDAAVDLSGGL